MRFSEPIVAFPGLVSDFQGPQLIVRRGLAIRFELSSTDTPSNLSEKSAKQMGTRLGPVTDVADIFGGGSCSKVRVRNDATRILNGYM